jgi:three-Cys-motif partner protein
MPRKKPTSEWAKEKLDRLIEMTAIISKECQGQYAEPEYGFWSIKKEIALMFWIWPFLQIAKEYFKFFYYLDLFAGSGLMKADNVDFVGSPIVAMGSTLPEVKFDKYVCLEIDPSRKDMLEKRALIASKYFETFPPTIFQADCNLELDKILKNHCPNDRACFLAFVDPQRITDLKWTTLHTLLTHGKGDIILNFPTSPIVRNLRKLESQDALTDFFGDSMWREVDPHATAIVEYFVNKISEYRSWVDSFPVKDDQHHRLYDLIFATNSKGMKNAFDDLKERLNRIQTKDIRGLYSVIAGDQRQLPLFP